MRTLTNAGIWGIYRKLSRLRWSIAVAVGIFLLSSGAVLATTNFHFDGEEYCSAHPAWPNGSWLGQFHPWHQQHYKNVFGEEAACPNWASDQRNSAINGLRDLGFTVSEPRDTSQPVNGYGRVLSVGPTSSAAEILNQSRDAVVQVQAGSRGIGSGFVFAIEQTTAFVATNHHVIDRANSLLVHTADGSSYNASLLGWDSDKDIAVLSMCCSYDFAALPWADAAAEAGDSVVAIGYPASSAGSATATTGVILEEDSVSRRNGFMPHSAPLNPGNSGGPLFSVSDGKVIGINVARGLEKLAFYAVPFQAVSKSIADWRSQLVISPAPPPASQAAYPPVQGRTSTYTVNATRDNISNSRTTAGERLFGVDIAVTARVDDVYSAGSSFTVYDAAGFAYEGELYIHYYEDTPVSDRLFQQSRINSGITKRGWVLFTLPQGAVPASVAAEGGIFGSQIVIANFV